MTARMLEDLAEVMRKLEAKHDQVNLLNIYSMSLDGNDVPYRLAEKLHVDVGCKTDLNVTHVWLMWNPLSERWYEYDKPEGLKED